jgi:hypothetical protein
VNNHCKSRSAYFASGTQASTPLPGLIVKTTPMNS